MATIKKAQKGLSVKRTPMQKLKSMYPKADTTAKGDLRFEDMAPLGRYDKVDQNRINATNKAFDAKYGKDKPAKDKKGGVVKKKMKNGGSLSALKASNKRVGPIDPKGAWTKVQEKTLAGAKGKASLTRDKELGATKMKMGGKAKKK